MFFSVIIPSYNRSALLPKTIESVLDQGFQDFEIIVVDDGSTDNTKETLEPFIRNKQIRYFFKENGERGAARNFGMKKAQGEWAVFLDSDDYWLTNHLECLELYIKNHPEINLFATKFWLEKDGQRKHSAELTALAKGVKRYNDFLKGGILACNFCVRLNHSELSYFVESREFSIMEDWIFIVQNTFNQPIYIIDKVTVIMNDHDGRSMRSDNTKIIKRRLKATELLIKTLNLTKHEQKKIVGNSLRFSAIHYYSDNKRLASICSLCKAILVSGILKNDPITLIKYIIGHSLVSQVTDSKLRR